MDKKSPTRLSHQFGRKWPKLVISWLLKAQVTIFHNVFNDDLNVSASINQKQNSLESLTLVNACIFHSGVNFLNLRLVV